VHLLGWVELPRTQEFILLAQITIGGGAGARLSKVRFSQLIHNWHAALNHFIIVFEDLLSDHI
jgi:hypothetical protein